MSDFDTVEKLISLDPNLASISYQAHEQVPVYVPWTRKFLSLGAGLDISSASKPGDVGTLTIRPCDQLVPANRIRFNGVIVRSYGWELWVAAGCGIIGASAKGEFAKSVSENRDSNKVSLQASLRVGQIGFSTLPELSPQSLTLLRKSPSDFNSTYGQYFAAALFIGADNTTFLSTSSSIDIRSEMRDIEVKAKILWKKITVYSDHRHSESASSTYDIAYDGFDTLSGYQRHSRATDVTGYDALKMEAAKNLSGGIDLVDRVKEGLKSLGLDEKKTMVMTEKQLPGVFNSGAVVEVMFLPYAGLRDYAAATCTRSLASQLEKVLQ
ncbi:hypothetical protein K438DRAFT_1957306 [Mycena galopus ATCC 62051]|nr:hypothetical protein K438DRAFT_1957306 [Mycena galopus ATCC 62051]